MTMPTTGTDVVGWSRFAYPTRQYYCPPHVPRSQRTLGERFTEVTREVAERVTARCERCGESLAPEIAALEGKGDAR